MCDSILAAGDHTRSGRTLFGKNSDRRAGECQPLLQFREAFHGSDSVLRCTHIEIPQAPHTYAVLGQSPWWVWGFEHGVNEFGVAIGNHSVFSKEPIEEVPGLIGMDLVRLGLERARSAREAVSVIKALVEAHGQGGAAFAPDGAGHHNSFAIADGSSALMLETTNRRWVVREAHLNSMSNHMALGSDLHETSPDIASFACDQGWWTDVGDRDFDFAEAYRNPHVPAQISEGRARRSRSLLDQYGGEAGGGLDPERFKSLLRDHGPGCVAPPSDAGPEDERYFTICAHNEVQGPTAGSMVVELPHSSDASHAPPAPWPVWISLATPCTGVFLPVYIDGVIPAALARGGEAPDDGSAWWRFNGLERAAERDLQEALPTVRTAWAVFEKELESRRVEVEAEVAERSAVGELEGASRLLTEFMDDTTGAALAVADRLTKSLNSTLVGSRRRS